MVGVYFNGLDLIMILDYLIKYQYFNFYSDFYTFLIQNSFIHS